MKATYSLVAATRPACTAAPYPGVGSVDHGRAEPAGDLGGAVARAVVDDDDREPRRDRGQQRAQGGRLVAAGQDEVADGLHVSEGRQVRGPGTGSDSLRTRDGVAGSPAGRAT